MKIKLLKELNLETINKLEKLYYRKMSEWYRLHDDGFPGFQNIISLFIDLNDEKTVRSLDKVNLVSWVIVCHRPDCSENVIEKYIDIVDWDYISLYFKMSPEFALKYIDEITEDIFNNPCYKKFPDSVKLLLKQKVNE
jgi:hypothetical protein